MATYTDPGLAIKKLASNVKARMAGQDEVIAEIVPAMAAQSRTYSKPQTYTATDPDTAPIVVNPDAGRNWGNVTDVMDIGPDLILKRTDGNAGQRLTLTGRAGLDPAIMPYYEVLAVTRTGSDGGGAVAGFQLHLGPDGGAGTNREFLYIEAVGERHPDGPHFRIGTHASGSGVRRPWRLESMGLTAMKFATNRTIEVFQPLVSHNGLSLGLDISRTAGNVTAVRTMVYSDAAGTTSAIFLGHSGGTKDTASVPGAGWTLGSVQFGAMNGSQQLTGAQVRALSDEQWVAGSAMGTRAEVHIVKKGTAVQSEALRVFTPSNQQAGLQVLVSRDGVTSALAQITIGAPDSAGTGYRALRIPN